MVHVHSNRTVADRQANPVVAMTPVPLPCGFMHDTRSDPNYPRLRD